MAKKLSNLEIAKKVAQKEINRGVKVTYKGDGTVDKEEKIKNLSVTLPEQGIFIFESSQERQNVQDYAGRAKQTLVDVIVNGKVVGEPDEEEETDDSAKGKKGKNNFKKV